jgi:hypothetical protein
VGADALWTRGLTAGGARGATFAGLDALTLLSAASARGG